MLELFDEDLQPGSGRLFQGLIRGLTEAALDPDVHIHEWLRCRPIGDHSSDSTW